MELDRLIALRRDLHKIPEGGHQERQTKEYILATLRALKPDRLDVYGETGVRAIFFCENKNAKTLGFRADMDALPILEQTGLPFASTNEGYMHACGHDGHMALLLCFLFFVSENRKKLANHVAAIFQPAEENLLGAKDIISLGVLENPRIDEIYGFHLMPSYEKGTIALSPGPVMAGNTSFELIINGKSAHAASPQNGADGILAAAHALIAIENRMTRLSQEQMSILSFGQIKGGSVPNALAERVSVLGTTRYFSNERKKEILRLLGEASSHAAQALGATARVIFSEKAYPPVINDEACVARALPLIEKHVPQAPQMTAEDFSCYLNLRPGFFGFIGVRDEAHASPLHSNSFDFDEAALLPALALYKRLALGY